MTTEALTRCGLAVLAALVVAGNARAQTQPNKETAFGLAKGMTLKQARAIGKVAAIPGQANTYHLSTTPQPVSPFVTYFVTISPKYGLCYILALSKPQSNETTVEFDTLRLTKALTSRYGTNTTQESKGSFTTLTWTNAQGPRTRIEFETTKDSIDGTYTFSLAYVFSNLQECLLDTDPGL